MGEVLTFLVEGYVKTTVFLIVGVYFVTDGLEVGSGKLEVAGARL
jgi:hypothetical protein